MMSLLLAGTTLVALCAVDTWAYAKTDYEFRAARPWARLLGGGVAVFILRWSRRKQQGTG